MLEKTLMTFVVVTTIAVLTMGMRTPQAGQYQAVTFSATSGFAVIDTQTGRVERACRRTGNRLDCTMPILRHADE